MCVCVCVCVCERERERERETRGLKKGKKDTSLQNRGGYKQADESARGLLRAKRPSGEYRQN